jgi:hypothetical protein
VTAAADPRGAVRAWVLARNPGLDPGDLRDDTPLLAGRLVTSLQVVDLLLLIESLRHAPVSAESLRPGAFRDIGTICRTFLADPAATDR